MKNVKVHEFRNLLKKFLDERCDYMIEILRLTADNNDWILEAADLLLEAFPHSWPDMEEATEEVHGCLEEEKIALVAVANEHAVGLIGAIPQYGTTGWELHPLVVSKAHRSKGIGSKLIAALEKEVLSHGGVMIYLGSDDEFGTTSLSNCDLFDDTYGKITNIVNLGHHPYEFYQKQGYKIVGVFPDANGIGKPDIWMAKRIKY
jgi:aminoglycoside 6'-N-acetyltransferase I